MVLGQDGGDVVPHDVGLRVAVQQQDGGARFVAAYQGVDPYPSRGKSDSLEQVGQRNSHMTLFPRPRTDVISRQPSLTERRLRDVGWPEAALSRRARCGHAGHQKGMVGYVWFCFVAAEAGGRGGRRGRGCRGGGVLVRGSSSAAPAASPVSSAPSPSSASTSAASSPAASSAASTASSSSAAVSPRGHRGGGVAWRSAAARPAARRGTCRPRRAYAQGAAGSVYQVIDFTNISNVTCTLYGYPGVSLGGGDAGHPGGPGGLAVDGRRPRARDARAGADGERAAADHPGAELPDGHVRAREDHVPADLPAEPDDARSTWPTRRRGARRTR